MIANAAALGDRVVRIGTRGSLLATTQAETVRAAITAAGVRTELVVVTTAGDKSAAPQAADTRPQLAALEVRTLTH